MASHRFRKPCRVLGVCIVVKDHSLPTLLADAVPYSITSVMQTGIARGSPRADFYGCLYFYVSEQLHEFAERLNRFRISFHILNEDACKLATRIQSNDLAAVGIPSTIRFDRIAVSNIIDHNYVGLPRVLSDWGPLLNERNSCATLLAYSLNWPVLHPGAKPGRDEIGEVTERMIETGKVCYLRRLNVVPESSYLTGSCVSRSHRLQRLQLRQRIKVCRFASQVVCHRSCPNCSSQPTWPRSLLFART